MNLYVDVNSCTVVTNGMMMIVAHQNINFCLEMVTEWQLLQP